MTLPMANSPSPRLPVMLALVIRSHAATARAAQKYTYGYRTCSVAAFDLAVTSNALATVLRDRRHIGVG